MPEDNKHNLLYFEAPSMRGLYALLNTWQEDNRKRLLSVSVQRDAEVFSCIALTNPTEVIICSGNSRDEAHIDGSRLYVCDASVG